MGTSRAHCKANIDPWDIKSRRLAAEILIILLHGVVNVV